MTQERLAGAVRDWIYDHYHLAYALGTALICHSLMFPSKRLAFLAWLVCLLLGALLEPCVNPQRQLYGRSLWRLSPDQPQVALTFDDGPSEDTEAILDILLEHQVKATFFCVGQKIEERPQVLERITREGHLLGNHTYSHRNLMLCGMAQTRMELSRTQQLIQQFGQQTPRYWRPPFGFRAPWSEGVARRLGLESVLWSINPRDFQNPGSEVIVQRVLGEAQPGVIVLLHDGFSHRGQTVEALRALIPALQERGCRLVRLDEADHGQSS